MNNFIRIGVVLSLATVSSFSLVADYRYTECSGTIIENYAGDSLNGQLSSTGATLTVGESTLSLTGSGSMSVEHDAKLDLTKSMTISLWVKQSKRGQQALITRGDGEGDNRKFASNAEYFLSVNSTGKIRYKHNGITGTYSDNAIPLNKWTHVVLTRDHLAKEIKIYINGTLDSTYSYGTNPISSNSEKLLVGQCSGCNGTHNFKGKLDEIKIYNHILSNNSVIELFDAEDKGVHEEGTCTVTPSPTAKDDREEVFSTGDVNFNVLDNDIDNNTEDSCNIQSNSVVLNPLTGAELSDDRKILVVENQGMWSVRDTGIVTFTPDTGYIDSPTPIQYHISDSCGNSSEDATITLIRRETNPNTGDNQGVSIGNRVWFDANQNGIQDNGEVGVNDIRVILLNSNGEEISRTTTNNNGEYLFNNIIAGEYTLRFENLATGDEFTTRAVGDNATIDSDVNAQGVSNTITITTNNNLNIDAGIISHGQDGANGQNGRDGINGQDGADGQNGRDGINGQDGADGQNGRDGIDGQDGADGRDGIDGRDGADGRDGIDGRDGADGKDGVCPVRCQNNSHTKNCNCECETYETSVPVLNYSGIGIIFLLSTLLGVFLFKEETLTTKEIKVKA